MNKMTFKDTYRNRMIICEKQDVGWVAVGNIDNVEIQMCMDETWDSTKVLQFCISIIEKVI